jgi:amino acid transporter
VTFSYRQVVSVYTKTGGSYVVTRDNFGVEIAQIAAVALMLDYIVTVAVQTSAGTAALISAFPVLGKFNLLITLAVIALLFYGNLRGVKEAGKLFAAPAYLFIFSVGFIILRGTFEFLKGSLREVTLNSGTINHC